MYCLKTELLPNKDRPFFTPYAHIKLKESCAQHLETASQLRVLWTSHSLVEKSSCCSTDTWVDRKWKAGRERTYPPLELQAESRDKQSNGSQPGGHLGWMLCSHGQEEHSKQPVLRAAANSSHQPPPINKQNIQQPSINKKTQIPLVFNCSL